MVLSSSVTLKSYIIIGVDSCLPHVMKVKRLNESKSEQHVIDKITVHVEIYVLLGHQHFIMLDDPRVAEKYSYPPINIRMANFIAINSFCEQPDGGGWYVAVITGKYTKTGLYRVPIIP